MAFVTSVRTADVADADELMTAKAVATSKIAFYQQYPAILKLAGYCSPKSFCLLPARRGDVNDRSE